MDLELNDVCSVALFLQKQLDGESGHLDSCWGILQIETCGPCTINEIDL